MKMKTILLVVLTLCLTVSLCACGDNGNSDSTNTTTQGGDTTTTTSTTTTAETTTTTTTVADGKVTYTVTVTDESGNPIPGAYLQLCLESCMPCVTNAQGIATWPNFDEADYKVSFMTLPEGYSSDVNEFHFEDGSYEMTIVLKATA